MCTMLIGISHRSTTNSQGKRSQLMFLPSCLADNVEVISCTQERQTAHYEDGLLMADIISEYLDGH